MLGLRKRVGDLESRVTHHDQRIVMLEHGVAQAWAKLNELVALNEQVLAKMGEMTEKIDALLEALDERAS